MINIFYISIGLFVLVACYFVFIRKSTFINKKLENFNGDDLNIHINNDLNTISSSGDIIE
jgi:hypothetical protein